MKLPKPFVEKEELVNVIVETPRDSRMKYAFDTETRLFKLKKLLPPDLAFPLDFGFISGTKGEDGDPLDVLVFFEKPTYPGILIECRIIGVMEAEQRDKDEKKFVRNDRLLAVAGISSEYARLKEVKDIEKPMLDSINHFFSYYHSVAGGEFIPLGMKDKKEAIAKIKAAQL